MYDSERAEKMKMEEKYLILKKDVKYWVYTTVTRAMKENCEKIMSGEADLEDELKKLKMRRRYGRKKGKV